MEDSRWANGWPNRVATNAGVFAHQSVYKLESCWTAYDALEKRHMPPCGLWVLCHSLRKPTAFACDGRFDPWQTRWVPQARAHKATLAPAQAIWFPTSFTSLNDMDLAALYRAAVGTLVDWRAAQQRLASFRSSDDDCRFTLLCGKGRQLRPSVNPVAVYHESLF